MIILKYAQNLQRQKKKKMKTSANVIIRTTLMQNVYAMF